MVAAAPQSPQLESMLSRRDQYAIALMRALLKSGRWLKSEELAQLACDSLGRKKPTPSYSRAILAALIRSGAPMESDRRKGYLWVGEMVSEKTEIKC